MTPGLLSYPVQDCAFNVHCTHWPVSDVHQRHRGTRRQRPGLTAKYDIPPDLTSSFHSPGQSLAVEPSQ